MEVDSLHHIFNLKRDLAPQKSLQELQLQLPALIAFQLLPSSTP